MCRGVLAIVRGVIMIFVYSLIVQSSLMRNNPAEIKAMTMSMLETSKMTSGSMMCIGNHIPLNVPPEGIKGYLELAAEHTR